MATLRGSLYLLRFLQIGSVIVPLALLALWGWQSCVTEHAHAEREARRNAELVREHVLKVVQTQERLLAHVVDMLGPLGWEQIARSEALHARLSTLASEVGNVSIRLIGPQGSVRASSHEFPIQPYHAGQDYVAALRASDDRLFIGERHARRSGVEVFAVARRRPGAAFDGIVASMVETDSLARFFRGIARDRNTAVSLIRADGRLLVSVPEQAPVTFGPQSGIMRAMSEADAGVFTEVARSDGRERIYAYSRVGSHPLFVSYGIPLSSVRAAWLRQMTLGGAVAVLLSAIALGLTSFLLRQTRADVRVRERLEVEVGRRTAELKQALADKDVLLREVHHRVKNNFQVIASLLGIQLRLGKDPWEGLRQSLARIHSMGLVHQQLYQTPDLSRLDLLAYLQTLVAHLQTAEGADLRRIRCELTGERVSVSLDDAIPIALIVNEVLSNAFKHAFPDERAGLVRVHVARERDALVITVHDDGIGGAAAFESPRTLGLRLIAALAGQIDASYRFAVDGGTKFTLVMPVRAAPHASAA